jgi:hypothetical protein
MKKYNKIEETIMKLLREMYQKASPPADINKLIETGEAKEPEFFNRYYLSSEEIHDIVDTWNKKSRLPQWKKKSVLFNIYLGASPCSNKEKVNQTRIKLGLKPI